MKPVAAYTLVVLSSLLATAHGQTPWVGPDGSARVDRHLLVKSAPGIALTEGNAGTGWTSTGVAEIDALIPSFGVVSVRRVHADPPRGRRDPELFHRLGLNRIYVVELRNARDDVPEIAAKLEELRAIERAWADGVVKHCNTPNDTLWSSQWNLTPTNVNCEPAWDDQTSATVIVAVIDSGADLTHPDLDANLWVNPGETAGNGKDDDGNGYVDDLNGWDFWNGDSNPNDDFGHGTHVSGILGAEGNNGRDVAGICWKVAVQEIKVLNASGAGTWTTIAQGITYAAENGALVANYSLGGTGGDPGVESAVQYAAGLDLVQVAAAGNNASSTPFYPAAYDPVIAVMASTITETRANWSNYGDWTDLCAPGDGVTSLWMNGGTNASTGTSQSSPHVAAIAAMVRTANPQFDRVDTEIAIKTGAKDLGGGGVDATYQWGLADLHESLAKARSISLSATSTKIGGSVDIYVRRADAPGHLYVLLPSLAGRLPGFDLSSEFADEFRVLPLNVDFITYISIVRPRIGVFVRFIDYLDQTGEATATLNIPAGNTFAGKVVNFSGVTFPADDLSRPSHVLGTIVLQVE